MAVNSDLTLISILENKNIFFYLLDRFSNDALEFNIRTYEKALAHTGENLKDSERSRLYETLSLDNLEYNGLLNYIDRRAGSFRLQDFVITMVRHLDSKRLRELSSADLNHIIKALEESLRQIEDPTLIWDEDKDDFKEMIKTVYDTFQNTFSILQTSVIGLKGQASNLAEVVDNKDYSTLERAEQVQQALHEILRIHERHITPTLQFLDANLDIKRTSTRLAGRNAPMAIVEKIIEVFSRRGLTSHVTRLQRIHLHMLDIASEVVLVASSLDSYVKYAEDERRRYNKIESLYNNLLNAVVETQDGKLTNNLLKTTNPVFKAVHPLGNIKNFRIVQATNVNWPVSQGTSALDEFLRVKLSEQPSDTQKTNKGKSLEELSESINEKIAAELRLSAIKKAMQSYKYSDLCTDIYQSLHSHLKINIPDYSLDMIIDAVPFLSSNGYVVKALPEAREELIHQGLKLSYKKRLFNKA